ncbi:MAG: L-rhamnose isomerase, partial [Verrucomicrobia bacterium]|nr:L-rhamnose isomerase [Verrucomicrobiota bacterium]
MTIHKAYLLAREQYAGHGIDTTRALKQLAAIRLSLHCWQGDDVVGVAPRRGNLGGVLPTGNYLGRARTPEELRTDLAKALSLIPGRHRVNLHAIYAETKARPADRDELAPQHFADWVVWARAHKLGLDFNGTFFSHPLAESGRTLSHPDRAIRRFWIDHARACRRI